MQNAKRLLQKNSYCSLINNHFELKVNLLNSSATLYVKLFFLEKTCYELTAPAHGWFTCNHGSDYDSLCIFICDKGYQIKGESTLKCTSDGWDYGSPRCISKYFLFFLYRFCITSNGSSMSILILVSLSLYDI